MKVNEGSSVPRVSPIMPNPRTYFLFQCPHTASTGMLGSLQRLYNIWLQHLPEDSLLLAVSCCGTVCLHGRASA